ncbi:hypothetical protein K8T06_08790, partial [bacterium]|nr:hypothetical protein [bacterium]
MTDFRRGEKALLTIAYVLHNHSMNNNNERFLLFNANYNQYCSKIAAEEFEIKNAYNNPLKDVTFLLDHFPEQFTFDGIRELIKIELLAQGKVLSSKEIEILRSQFEIIESDPRESYSEYASLIHTAQNRDFSGI